jgi:hypothetical protein
MAKTAPSPGPQSKAAATSQAGRAQVQDAPAAFAVVKDKEAIPEVRFDSPFLPHEHGKTCEKLSHQFSSANNQTISVAISHLYEFFDSGTGGGSDRVVTGMLRGNSNASKVVSLSCGLCRRGLFR